MPHVIVEYSANLKQDGAIGALLKKLNTVLINQDGMFPIGGVRSRAIELHDYCIADGSVADDGFVHVTVKIGRGRSEELKKKVGDQLFEAIKTHFAAIYAQRGLALSMELLEFSEAGTWKQNNLHARYKKA